MNHFINTAATDLSRARTTGLNQLTPEPFPVLMIGTRSLHKFFFAERGTLEDWSGDPTYGLRVTIGDAFKRPVASTFNVAVGAEDPIAVQFDVDQAGLQNILNDITTVSDEGGVDVIGQLPGQFVIAYRTLGTPTPITTDGALLVPDCTATITTLAAGDTQTRCLLLLTLDRTTPAQVTSWTPITTPYAGWSGVIPLTSSACYELLRLNGVRVGDYTQVSTLLTVEVIDASGNNFAYYQTQITLRAQNYMITSLLPIGPSQHAQSFDSQSDFDVVPESQIHTETVTITGDVDTWAAIIRYPAGIGAGARVDIVALFPLGAQDGSTLNIYDADGSTTLFNFVRSDGCPSALFSVYADGAGHWLRKVAVIPAFAV